MRCYYHPEKDAIGICSSCRRGICRECAQEIGKSLACSGHCEEDVTIDESRVPTQETIDAQLRDSRFTPYFFFIGGLLIFSWSVPAVIILHSKASMPFIFWGGIYLLVAGSIMLVRWQKKRLRAKSARWIQR